MIVIRSPKKLTAQISQNHREGLKVGFVPTMGALHEGHLSLVRRARRENDRVIVSIFVNPLQFSKGEDYGRYPKTFARDKKLLQQEKVDYLFCPAVSDVYPEGFNTSVCVKDNELKNALCGAFRPGHFDGVTTVVAKLFIMTNPETAYFGEKDYQQWVLIKKLVRDLGLQVKIKTCPIVREADGLALSSRNQYLTKVQRQEALALSRALFEMEDALKRSKESLLQIRRDALKRLKKAANRVDYLEIVDPQTLTRLEKRQKKMVLAGACYVGKTRLIDNVIMRASKP